MQKVGMQPNTIISQLMHPLIAPQMGPTRMLPTMMPQMPQPSPGPAPQPRLVPDKAQLLQYQLFGQVPQMMPQNIIPPNPGLLPPQIGNVPQHSAPLMPPNYSPIPPDIIPKFDEKEKELIIAIYSKAENLFPKEQELTDLPIFSIFQTIFDDDPEYKVWYYYDPSNKLQGPFSSTEMDF